VSVTSSSDHHRLTHAIAGRNLKTLAIRLAVYAVIAVLVLKLLPGLEGAAERLAHVSWLWLLAAVALEIGSETGYVLSWHAVIDPEDTLAGSAGSNRMATRVAWAQLGGGTLVPAGAFGTLGVGGWLLDRLGMPKWRIAERELSLSLLNTAVDALTLLIVGVALAIGILKGSGALELTLVPALVAAVCRPARTASGASTASVPRRWGRSPNPSRTSTASCSTGSASRACSERSGSSVSTCWCCGRRSWASTPTRSRHSGSW
jgi:hypothetical protein